MNMNVLANAKVLIKNNMFGIIMQIIYVLNINFVILQRLNYRNYQKKLKINNVLPNVINKVMNINCITMKINVFLNAKMFGINWQIMKNNVVKVKLGNHKNILQKKPNNVLKIVLILETINIYKNKSV